jgi:GT2 family glycosyltransferase
MGVSGHEIANCPRVAVVLLNWNNTEDTLECVSSLRLLNYPAYECVIVDNGSKKESLDMLLASAGPATILRNKRNLGFARGCNVGIRWALKQGFDYVWLLNSDTTVDADCLTELISIAEQDPKIGIVGSILYFSSEPTIIQSAGGLIDSATGRGTMLGLGEEDTGQYESVRDVDYVSGGVLMIKSRTIEDVGLLDGRFFMYYEDTDWGIRTKSEGWRVVVAPKAKIWHKDKASAGEKKPYFVQLGYFLFLYKNFPHLLPHALRLYARHYLRPHLERGQWRLAWSDMKVYLLFLSRLTLVRANLQP